MYPNQSAAHAQQLVCAFVKRLFVKRLFVKRTSHRVTSHQEERERRQRLHQMRRLERPLPDDPFFAPDSRYGAAGPGSIVGPAGLHIPGMVGGDFDR